MGDMANWYHWLEERPGRWLHAQGYDLREPEEEGAGPARFTKWRIVGIEEGTVVRVGLRVYTLDGARQMIAELHRVHGIPNVRSA